MAAPAAICASPIGGMSAAVSAAQTAAPPTPLTKRPLTTGFGTSAPLIAVSTSRASSCMSVGTSAGSGGSGNRNPNTGVAPIRQLLSCDSDRPDEHPAVECGAGRPGCDLVLDGDGVAGGERLPQGPRHGGVEGGRDDRVGVDGCGGAEPRRRVGNRGGVPV